MSGPAAAAADLSRRLERYRAARAGPGTPDDSLPYRRIPARELAERLAGALDGEIVTTPTGSYVRVDGGSLEVGLDRRRLSTLPGHPPPDRPLVCLDTETTGLATATGTVAFLIGLGWWEGRRFRQVQLLLPDHADEPALLDQLAHHIPAEAWL
ncbi:MAG TPA: ribonuclease H-like domain-containing protein, partial [Candidatus Limnocylindrales bacterium]